MTLTIRILAWLALAAAGLLLARGLAPGESAWPDEEYGRLTTEARRHGAEREGDATGRAAGVSPPVRSGVDGADLEFDALANARPPLWADGFERSGRTMEQPEGWHYLRGGRLAADGAAAEGRSCVVFRATSPGRDAEMRGSFPLAGIDAAGLTVSVAVRLADVRPGQFSEQRPAVLIDFLDRRGEVLGQRKLGPWQGTAGWTRHELTLPVPARATDMLLRIGLFGATGEAAFDALAIRAAEVNESIFPR